MDAPATEVPTEPTERPRFSLFEILIGIVLLGVGLSGLLSAVFQAQTLERATEENCIAHVAISDIIEEFRESCRRDFDASVAAALNGHTHGPNALSKLGTTSVITTEIVRDERSELNPSVDLDGSGQRSPDNEDVPCEDLTAAVLVVRLAWTGALGSREVQQVTVVPRGSK